MMKVLVVISIFMSFVSCSKVVNKYDVELIEVNNSRNLDYKYNKGKITKKMGLLSLSNTSKLNNEVHNYEDMKIDIDFEYENEGLVFKLKNKTRSELKIIWDDCYYIGKNLEKYDIMHTGVKYINKEMSNRPTVLTALEELYDKIIPIKNVYWRVYDNKGEWVNTGFVPSYSSIKHTIPSNNSSNPTGPTGPTGYSNHSNSQPEKIDNVEFYKEQYVDNYIGSIIEISFVFLLNEEKYEYRYKFKYNDIKVLKEAL